MKSLNHPTRNSFFYFLHSLTLVALIGLIIGSLINLLNAARENFYSAVLLTLAGLILLGLFFYARIFLLRAQDRSIRAEENLRHYILTGKELDKELTIQQILALRFASDEEFVRLAKRAVAEALNKDEIKEEIKSWKVDDLLV